MAKAHAFLDITGLPENLRNEIVGIGGEPDFVEFVLAWHGMIGSGRQPFTDERPTVTVIKRIKRRLQKIKGKDLGQEWKAIRYEWRRRPKLILRRTLFKLEPLPENPSHRPRQEAQWKAVCDLRAYFLQANGQPKMELIRGIIRFSGVYWEFNAEWQRRKSWFSEAETADRLERLTTFFTYNHNRVIESLRKGTPLYALFPQSRIYPKLVIFETVW